MLSMPRFRSGVAYTRWPIRISRALAAGCWARTEEASTTSRSGRESQRAADMWLLPLEGQLNERCRRWLLFQIPATGNQPLELRRRDRQPGNDGANPAGLLVEI